jgi:hypothetical protein
MANGGKEDEPAPADEVDCTAVLTDDEELEAEITALVAIVDTFGKLSYAARRRVLRWATSRFVPEVK